MRCLLCCKTVGDTSFPLHVKEHFSYRRISCKHCCFSTYCKLMMEGHCQNHGHENHQPPKLFYWEHLVKIVAGDSAYADRFGFEALERNFKLRLRGFSSTVQTVHCLICPTRSIPRHTIRSHIDKDLLGRSFEDVMFTCRDCNYKMHTQEEVRNHERTHGHLITKNVNPYVSLLREMIISDMFYMTGKKPTCAKEIFDGTVYRPELKVDRNFRPVPQCKGNARKRRQENSLSVKDTKKANVEIESDNGESTEYESDGEEDPVCRLTAPVRF
ncbi:hypothetical protein L596_011668 [Steinernema carpocapsae]|uniref:C2H2-type domain-containing protein n=1 Tax=Steinernema carpocapsae TaxID=34508 RepID=A0A4V6A4M2_STECR|nr:hypothetical protein L596_011668 [Steinernema carpocapsae]